MRLDSIRDQLERIRDKTVDAITGELLRFEYITRDGRKVEPPADNEVPIFDPDEEVPDNMLVRVVRFVCGHWTADANGQPVWSDEDRPEDEPRPTVTERVREREPESVEVEPALRMSGTHPLAGKDYPECRGPVFGSPPDPSWHSTRAPDGRTMWWPPSQTAEFGATTGRRFYGAIE